MDISDYRKYRLRLLWHRWRRRGLFALAAAVLAAVLAAEFVFDGSSVDGLEEAGGESNKAGLSPLQVGSGTAASRIRVEIEDIFIEGEESTATLTESLPEPQPVRETPPADPATQTASVQRDRDDRERTELMQDLLDGYRYDEYIEEFNRLRGEGREDLAFAILADGLFQAFDSIEDFDLFLQLADVEGVLASDKLSGPLIAKAREKDVLANLLFGLIDAGEESSQGFGGLLGSVARAYEQQLLADDAIARVGLWQQLVSLDPQQLEYRYFYARSFFDTGQYQEARSQLEHIIGSDHALKKEAEALLQEIDFRIGLRQSSGDQLAIANSGRRFMVDGIINGEQKIRMMIDSGASLTAIDRDLAYGLSEGLEDLRGTVIGTVNGDVDAEVGVLQKLEVGSQTLKNLEVVVTPLSDVVGVDALLGMNFLEQFELFYNQEEGTLYLTRLGSGPVGDGDGDQ